MGDKIKIEKIVLLYGHLYQVDYYNVTKDYRGRLFIEKSDIDNAEIEQEVEEVVLDPSTLVYVNEENFSCSKCSANVFSKVKLMNGDIVYRCHGCGELYQGE